ncbi:MAG: hypothetical protein LBG12_06490 [Synergistaceae bacterium]|jgi:hypothetical protein|nr:hypothetical protein [Synergistaceae bacterium]
MKPRPSRNDISAGDEIARNASADAKWKSFRGWWALTKRSIWQASWSKPAARRWVLELSVSGRTPYTEDMGNAGLRFYKSRLGSYLLSHRHVVTLTLRDAWVSIPL